MVRTHLSAMKPKTPATRPTQPMLPSSFFIFVILNRRRALSASRLASLRSDPPSSATQGRRQMGTVHPLRGELPVQTATLRLSAEWSLDCSALLWPVPTISNRSTGQVPPFLRESGEVSQQVPSRLSYGQRVCPLPVCGPGREPEREEHLTSATRTDLIILSCQPPIIPQAGATGARTGNAGIVPTFKEERKCLIVNECGMMRVGNQCIKTASRCTRMHRGG
jgi:hypothetical protein